jgi:predicted nucleic acid-binding protein
MIVHQTDSLLENAIKHGVRFQRPVYDSLYLVLAEACGGQVVTADARLYRGVKSGPLETLVLWVTDPL